MIDCAALPDPLLQSELFGHVKGAFTGADSERPGLLHTAGRGTLLLDEVDKASPALQAALLHVLDRGEVRALGGRTPHPVRARIVLAANRNPMALAARGRFLPDLAYRIAGFSVLVPPLRERREDFDLLLALALRRIRIEEGGAGRVLTSEARELLAGEDWPGNVRELFHRVHAAALLGEDDRWIGVREIRRAGPGSMPRVSDGDPAGERGGNSTDPVPTAANPDDLAGRLRDFERGEILTAMRKERGCQTRAAARLGLSRRGLNKKLHRLALLGALRQEGLARWPPRDRRSATAVLLSPERPDRPHAVRDSRNETSDQR